MDQTSKVTLWKVFENTASAPMTARYNGTSREEAMRAYAACEHGFFQGVVFDGHSYDQFESDHK